MNLLQSPYSLVRTFFVACTALVVVSSCGDKIGSFEFTETSNEQTIPGRGLGTPSILNDILTPFTFNINLEEELDKRDTGPAKAVFLEDLDFKVTDTAEKKGESDNFDFLESITIYADADNQDKVKIAWLNNVPKGEKRIDLDVDDDVNLKPYIEAGMKLKVDAEGQPPETDTSIQAVATLLVELL